MRVSSSNITTLLVDFLNEILTLTHICKAVFSTLQIKQLTDTELNGEVEGIRVKSFDEDVKAVTYYEAQMQANDLGQLETIVVFDI
nr:archease [Fulvivirga imtechensis]